MPKEYIEVGPGDIRHSDEMQEIITAVPAKLIRWGMILFLFVLVMIISLSAFIRYPDIVKATLTISESGQDKGSFICKIIIPGSEIGTVHAGQNVIIKLKGYPDEQNGIVRGSIRSISKTVDNAGSYLASVIIGSNNTNINMEGQLKPGMLADAEIVTQDATILQRLSHGMFKAVKNK